jgi:hypothetical protein
MNVDEAKVMLIAYRINPEHYLAPIGDWCGAYPPNGRNCVCSRKKGHQGLHFAQYGNGEICPFEPNPWE